MDFKSKYIKYKIKYLELKKSFDTFTHINTDTNIIKGGSKKKLKNKNFTKFNKNNFKQSRMEVNKLSENNTPKYIENVSEPWFTLISLGLKSVEGRKNKGKFKEMKVGDTILWTNNDFSPRNVLTKIVSKAEYLTFKEYLENEGLNKCLPGITDINTGLSVYYKYYTKDDEKEFGVVAIRLEIV